MAEQAPFFAAAWPATGRTRSSSWQAGAGDPFLAAGGGQQDALPSWLQVASRRRQGRPELRTATGRRPGRSSTCGEERGSKGSGEGGWMATRAARRGRQRRGRADGGEQGRWRAAVAEKEPFELLLLFSSRH
nr:unnamed protein product [Digitaria exilis]